MNQERITSLALEVAREMRCEFPADEWDNSGEEHSEESYTFYKSELIEFATKFLARVRKEESKEAVATIHVHYSYGSDYLAYALPVNGIRLAPGTKLFLHPQEKDWISVEDVLPANETPVLITFDGNTVIGEIRWEHLNFEDTFESYWYWDDPTDDGQDWERELVTHWMPLPKPPAAKEEAK